MKRDIVRRLAGIAHYATPRFSLGQLLLAVALIALGFGWSTRRVTHTGRELDVAILGEGYFSIVNPDSGEYAYTRDGHLSLNNLGQLGITRGTKHLRIVPEIPIPDGLTGVEIGADGTVCCAVGGRLGPTPCGQFGLARFSGDPPPAPGLDGVFRWDPSLHPHYDAPGNRGFGRLAQGYLDATWIDIAKGLLPLALLGIGAWLLFKSRWLLERLRSWRGRGALESAGPEPHRAAA